VGKTTREEYLKLKESKCLEMCLALGAWTDLTEGERYLRLQKNGFETKFVRKIINLLSHVVGLWAGR